MRTLFAAASLAVALFASPALADWQEDIIPTITADSPNTVKQVVWYSDRGIWVGVMDDGSKRDGLAEYFCLIVKNEGTLHIRIIDYYKALQDDITMLGRTVCNAKGS